MSPRSDTNRQNQYATTTQRSRRRSISTFGVLLFSAVLAVVFALGALTVAAISFRTGGSMIIAHALLALAGACFVGGLSTATVTSRLS